MKNLQEEIIQIREIYKLDIPDYNELNEDSLVELCEVGMLQVVQTGSTTFLNVATDLLENWLKLNFATFKETEGIYQWCKSVCDARTEAMNRWRAHGYGTFKEWYENQR